MELRLSNSFQNASATNKGGIDQFYKFNPKVGWYGNVRRAIAKGMKDLSSTPVRLPIRKIWLRSVK